MADLFSTPLNETRVKEGVYAYQYPNGVVNIEGRKYVGYTVDEAIELWRQNNCTMKIDKFLGEIEIDIDILNHLDSEDKEAIVDFIENYEIEEAVDYLREVLQGKGAFEVDVIGYREAMDYLIENDVSLSESMGIAQELGYEPTNIGSELLARLLQTQELTNEYQDLESCIADFFEEL